MAAANRNTAARNALDTVDWWGELDSASSRARQNRPRPRARETNPPRTARRVQAQSRREQARCRALKLITMGVLLIALFVQISRYAQIASQSREISQVVCEINALSSDNANLKLRLSARENINRVRDEAMYRLGMHYPEEGQTRIVSIGQLAANPQTQTAANSANTGG